MTQEKLLAILGAKEAQLVELTETANLLKAKLDKLEKEKREASNGVPENVPSQQDVEQLLPTHQG